ncbi:MAG: efflux RND transporter periplasmic adaptor subunit [Steroidobacteraceae bacterium]
MNDGSGTFQSQIRRVPVLAWIGLIVGVGVLGAAGGYWFARHGSGQTDVMRPATQGNSAGPGSSDRPALYWYDPMVPNQHFDKPGKSPFMDMQLVPKYADEGGASGGVQISPNIVQNLGLRTAPVELGRLSQPIEAVGNIGFNQRNVAIVQSRTNGFVSRVYNRAPADVLRRGAPLVDLLVPEWAGAQAEFLALLRSGDRDLIEAAHQRLVLLGMPADLITRIEDSHQQQATITIAAPIAGAIESLDVREGMTVSAGVTLAKINGLETVWLEAAIPEAQSGLVALGQSVEARLAAYSGETVKGRVIAILPETSVETRTTRVRVDLPNPNLRLRPGMFAQLQLHAGDDTPRLWVPTEAIIRTGTRNLVIVAAEANRFEPTEVQIGPEAGGRTVILAGLKEGQDVVASGQFLIDSEASLRGVLARLNSSDSTNNTDTRDTENMTENRQNAMGVNAATAGHTEMNSPATALHEATGKVESVTDQEIVLSHGPVKSLGWPPMTMPFKLPHPDMARALKPGDTVHFQFRKAEGGFAIERLEKLRKQP